MPARRGHDGVKPCGPNDLTAVVDWSVTGPGLRSQVNLRERQRPGPPARQQADRTPAQRTAARRSRRVRPGALCAASLSMLSDTRPSLCDSHRVTFDLGTFRVTSPPGGPTHVEAVIPCER
jgi:hypothetical protein